MPIDEQTVLNRLFSLTESIGKTETCLSLTSQSLDQITKKLNEVVINQEKLLQLQTAQEKAIQQINDKDAEHHADSKKKAKELFQKSDELEDRISRVEGQLVSIKQQQQNSSDETKEKIKGKWAFYAATVAALISSITAIILSLI